MDDELMVLDDEADEAGPEYGERLDYGLGLGRAADIEDLEGWYGDDEPDDE